MKFSPAVLVTGYSDDEKRQLRLVGATWSSTAKGYFLTHEQKEMIDNGDVPEPTLPNGINIEDMVTEWKVSGDTYDKRAMIKDLGGRWQPSSKSWAIPREKASMEDIMAALA